MVVNTQIIDEEFDISNCQNNILSIQISLDGFYFSIFDKSLKKFVALFCYSPNAATVFELCSIINDIYATNELLKQNYSEVAVMYINRRSALIPKFLLDNDKEQAFTNFLFEQNKGEVLINSTIPNLSITASGLVPSAIFNLINEKHHNCNFKTLAAPLVSYISKNFAYGFKLAAIKFSHQLTIIAIDNENITFYNNFYVKNDEECLYYLLYVAKQLAVDPSICLILVGQFDPKSNLIAQIKKYFKNTILPSFPQYYAVSYKIHKMPDQAQLPLFELALCV